MVLLFHLPFQISRKDFFRLEIHILGNDRALVFTALRGKL